MIVNEIAVVRAAQGTGRGIGQVYVGIYSPSRAHLRRPHPRRRAALQPGQPGADRAAPRQPLDVLFGESHSRLRDFEVGFGVLRGFRAEAPADAPEIDSDLRLVERQARRARSPTAPTRLLENVAVLFGGGAAVLPTLGPGETQATSTSTSTSNHVLWLRRSRSASSARPSRATRRRHGRVPRAAR